LPEVQANQFYLEPFYRLDPSEFPIPCYVTFDRTIYSSLADKIGLLDIHGEVIDYYTKINLVEKSYINMSEKVSPLCLQNKEGIEQFREGKFVDDFLKKVEMAYEFGDVLEGSLLIERRKGRQKDKLLKAK
jgi:hypothetical protein